MNKISFIGLGKLGLPLATCMAKNDINVVAIDKNKKVINSLQAGKAPFFEPGLQENINLAAANIEYTTEYTEVESTDTTVILVNTPSNKKDGSFSNLYIEQSLLQSVTNLKDKKGYHLFIISSTVMPGSIIDHFIPLIESKTDWLLNRDYGICYIPDFVALGNIISDFENPEFVIIGESDEKAGDLAINLYSRIFKNQPRIKRMSLIESEIAKISLNAYICTKISFVNYLARVAEKFSGTNVDKITESIGIDKRISPYYFKSGLSFGGTCFPRDTWAFIKMSDKLGLRAHHVEAAEKLNQEQDRHLLDKVLKIILDNKLENRISILGLGFKNNTPVINESATIKLIEKLLTMNYDIHVYDPIKEAVENTKLIFGDRITFHNTPERCVRSTGLVVLANWNTAYSTIQEWIGDGYILDCWRILPNDKKNVFYIGK